MNRRAFLRSIIAAIALAPIAQSAKAEPSEEVEKWGHIAVAKGDIYVNGSKVQQAVWADDTGMLFRQVTT
jgi:hypothetical protein